MSEELCYAVAEVWVRAPWGHIIPQIVVKYGHTQKEAQEDADRRAKLIEEQERASHGITLH